MGKRRVPLTWRQPAAAAWVHGRWCYTNHGCRCGICKADYKQYQAARYRAGVGLRAHPPKATDG